MPIFVGNYGSSKILGLTKSSQDQWNVKTDTIFHSSLPYVRVVEHDLTSFSWEQVKMWQQQYNSSYWYQTHPDGAGYQPQSIWWCGQVFPLTDQLKNMLQNTNRAFMIFVQWNDGWWEPYNPVSMEHKWLYTWDGPGYTDQQQIQVADWFRSTYGMGRYSSQFFIPRRKRNDGTFKVDTTQYVTKVKILELVGLDVTSSGAVTVQSQNPNQNSEIRIDNTRFIVGNIDIMQEKFLALATSTTPANQSSISLNVQQDLLLPQNLTYTLPTLDLISSNRTLGGGGVQRNTAPIIMGTIPSQPTWEQVPGMLTTLVVMSLTNNWTRKPPSGWAQPGGVLIPRLGSPNNYTTYIQQPQSVRRDDFYNRGMGSEQATSSKLLQVQVLQGAKFGSGVYFDSTKPQIGRGDRQLFSPQMQGVARVGPTRLVMVPRESLINSGLGNTNVYQFHHKVQLHQFTLTQEEQGQNEFILSQQARYNPLGTAPSCQITTIPRTDHSQFRKTKRSAQDGEVGYSIQNCTVDDHFAVASPASWDQSGEYRQNEQTRQVHQIHLQSGDKYLLASSEEGIDNINYPVASSGIFHYLERSGNTIYLMSETYLSTTFKDSSSIIGSMGHFCGGFGIGLTQVL